MIKWATKYRYIISSDNWRHLIHSYNFAWREAEQRSPILQFALSRGPRVLVQYTAADIRVLLTAFKECAVSISLLLAHALDV
jgi:hypothetical protein